MSGSLKVKLVSVPSQTDYMAVIIVDPYSLNPNPDTDPDSEFEVNPDPDNIQGFDDQILQKIQLKFFYIFF
jgi:hypothetical protein